MVLLNSPQIGAPPIRSNPDASPEKLCTEVCAHAICRKFGGRTFLRQFFPMADVKKTRVNTGEKDGGPGRDRTDDLFHAMEARSQLRHRPTCKDTTLGANDLIYFRRVKRDSQRGRASARPTATTLPRASAGCPI